MDLRIAIVGCGALTRTFYLPVLKKMQIIPHVLVDPNLQTTRTLAQEYDVPNVATDCNDIVDICDRAVIASPNYLHAPQALFFLQRGKHVLLEKPMATTEKEGQDLIKSAHASGVKLQIGMMRRFWKINNIVREILENELLGKLLTISMEEGGVLDWPVQSAAIFKPEQSLGGVLMDTGSHTLDLLNWWLQEPSFDINYEDNNHGGVESDCKLEIEFKNSGLRAVIKLSRIRNMSNEFTLTGTKGWIKVKPWGNKFETSDLTTEKFILSKESSVKLKQQGFEDLFTTQMVSWLEAIQNDTIPVIDAESVLPSIRMIEHSYMNRRQIVYDWN